MFISNDNSRRWIPISACAHILFSWLYDGFKLKNIIHFFFIKALLSRFYTLLIVITLLYIISLVVIMLSTIFELLYG